MTVHRCPDGNGTTLHLFSIGVREFGKRVFEPIRRPENPPIAVHCNAYSPMKTVKPAVMPSGVLGRLPVFMLEDALLDAEYLADGTYFLRR